VEGGGTTTSTTTTATTAATNNTTTNAGHDGEIPLEGLILIKSFFF